MMTTNNTEAVTKDAKLAGSPRPTHINGFIGRMRYSDRIEYFASANIAALWSDDAVPAMVPVEASIIDTVPFPILQSFVTSGHITFMGERYVGHSPDGFAIPLGNVGREQELEDYLFTHSDPRNW